jgi:putative ABC transport system permease protein
MRHVTLRNLFSRKLRLLTTSIAIAFGVAFVTGALILGATINKTFDDLFSNAYKNTDAVVRGQLLFSEGDSDVRLPINSSLVDQVKAIPGVADADVDYFSTIQLVAPNGKKIGMGGTPSYGDVWSTDPQLNPFQLVSGHAPDQDNEVVIDKGTAKNSKIKLGQTITVLTANAPQNFVVAGIAKFGQVDSPAGSAYALFNHNTSARLLSQPGKTQSIDVVSDKKESQSALVSRLQASLPKDLNVVTGKAIEAESDAQLKKDTKFVSLILEVFGGITLFVGAFIINNTFSILLAQRLRETALLRAIGARRRQVLGSMMVEAFALGLIASILGIIFGILISMGIKALLQALNVQIAEGAITVPPSAIVTALIAGIGITMVASVLPARRSSKVPPIAALRSVAIDDTGRSVRRFIVGLVIAIIGIASMAIGLITSVAKPYIFVGAGAALVFIGVAIMGPVISRPLSWLLGWPVVKLFGTTGLLARQNALRNPRRTSSTAAALMVGVAVVGLFSVVFTSVRVSVENSVDKVFNGDFIVTTSGAQGFDTGVAAQIKQKSQISVVAEERDFAVSLNGNTTNMAAIDFKQYPKVINMPVESGSFANVGPNNFATSKKIADNHHWQLGQPVTVQFTQGPPVTLTLAATFNDSANLLNYAVPLQTYEASGAPQYDYELFINKASRASASSAREAITSVTDRYPQIKVQDETQFKRQIGKQIDSALNFFYGLLALAVIIALIGITNTLALSVLERTQEIGLMRAVGMTRWQSRFMVCWESVIVALLGTLLGLVIGVLFGWALVSSLGSQGINTFSVPVGTMVAIVLVAAIAGILAALVPARRAAKLNIIRAISAE